MISGLKPYPEYTETGLPWIRKMPVHWAQRRTKFLFRERVQKGFPNEPLLAATQSKGVVRKEDYGTRTVTAMKDFHLLKLVEGGDFVISLRSFEGGLEISHARGIISPAYTVLKPNPDIYPGYYARFFKSPDFIHSLTLFVTGIREGQNIDYERLSRAYMPLPPKDEQIAIGKFLNWANGRLERAIRAKRKTIALLNEQKQAIIHRAVTRGLNPDAPTKPSGIPWFKEIPSHWEFLKLRRYCSVFAGATPSRYERKFWDGGTIPWLASGDVNMRRIKSASQFITEAGFAASSTKWIRPKSLVIALAGQGRTKGMVATIEFNTTGNQSLAAVVPNPKKIDYRFLAYYIESRYLNIRNLVGDGLRDGLNLDHIKAIPIPIPPLEEQEKTADFLDTETQRIDCVIQGINRTVKLFEEYRSKLTADVVTGKLDVRGVAAKLPDYSIKPEPDSSEPIEESETEESAI